MSINHWKPACLPTCFFSKPRPHECLGKQWMWFAVMHNDPLTALGGWRFGHHNQDRRQTRPDPRQFTSWLVWSPYWKNRNKQEFRGMMLQLSGRILSQSHSYSKRSFIWDPKPEPLMINFASKLYTATSASNRLSSKSPKTDSRQRHNTFPWSKQIRSDLANLPPFTFSTIDLMTVSFRFYLVPHLQTLQNSTVETLLSFIRGISNEVFPNRRITCIQVWRRLDYQWSAPPYNKTRTSALTLHLPTNF